MTAKRPSDEEIERQLVQRNRERAAYLQEAISCSQSRQL